MPKTVVKRKQQPLAQGNKRRKCAVAFTRASSSFIAQPPVTTSLSLSLSTLLLRFPSFSSFIPQSNCSFMSHNSPIFPIPHPQHFSDYGFDPQIDYFQVLEEARKHKRETLRSIDSIHFKLQKPVSRDDSTKTKKNINKKRWWKNALLFFKWKWIRLPRPSHSDRDDVHHARARAFRASISGPVYITESRSGSTSPYRTTNRPSSGPLAGTSTPTWKGEPEIPYMSLRELNVEQQQRIATSTIPIYLVT